MTPSMDRDFLKELPTTPSFAGKVPDKGVVAFEPGHLTRHYLNLKQRRQNALSGYDAADTPEKRAYYLGQVQVWDDAVMLFFSLCRNSGYPSTDGRAPTLPVPGIDEIAPAGSFLAEQLGRDE